MYGSVFVNPNLPTYPSTPYPLGNHKNVFYFQQIHPQTYPAWDHEPLLHLGQAAWLPVTGVTSC